jgi:hypothetical protein
VALDGLIVVIGDPSQFWNVAENLTSRPFDAGSPCRSEGDKPSYDAADLLNQATVTASRRL